MTDAPMTYGRYLALDDMTVPDAERTNLKDLGEWIARIVRAGEC
mgnify:CR=1 FL=1